MNKLKKDNYKELKEKYDKTFPIMHYYCEDSWYSCPKAEDGCANEGAGKECNCGAISNHKRRWLFILRKVIPMAEEKGMDKLLKQLKEKGIIYDYE